MTYSRWEDVRDKSGLNKERVAEIQDQMRDELRRQRELDQDGDVPPSATDE